MRRAVRRGARDDAVGADARDARAHERLRGAARPAGRVVSLPPPVRRAAAQRARAQRAGVVAELNRRAMAWCIANDLPEAAVVYGHAAGETDTVAGLVDALALPLYYDGRMETVEEWLGWFSDDELVRYPGARRLRSLAPRADGAARRGRAVARARRRGDLDDPALGRQRHDRALGRHPAGAHDARRCRAGARRRRSGAGSVRPRERLDADSRSSFEALRMRCSARPIGRRTTSRQPSRRGWPSAPSRTCYVAAGTARAARGQAGSLGRGSASAHARHRRSSRRRASATTRRARSCTRRRRASRSTRRDRRRRARRWRAPTGCGRCSTTASLADDRRSGSSSRAPISRSARPAPPARSSPRPSGCSSCARTWARSSRMRASCASAWRRPSGPAGAWAMSLTGAELRLLPYLATHLTFPEIASTAVHLAQHRQDRGRLDLPQARRVLAQRGDRACRRGRAAGELDLSAAGGSHPRRMTRRPAAVGQHAASADGRLQAAPATARRARRRASSTRSP